MSDYVPMSREVFREGLDRAHANLEENCRQLLARRQAIQARYERTHRAHGVLEGALERLDFLLELLEPAVEADPELLGELVAVEDQREPMDRLERCQGEQASVLFREQVAEIRDRVAHARSLTDSPIKSNGSATRLESAAEPSTKRSVPNDGGTDA